MKQILSVLAAGLAGRRCEIYLFGSRATGDYSAGSDYDLIVFSPDEIAGELSLIRERLEDSNIPFLVDLVDGSRTSLEFREKAKREGILLWSSYDNGPHPADAH